MHGALASEQGRAHLASEWDGIATALTRLWYHTGALAVGAPGCQKFATFYRQPRGIQNIRGLLLAEMGD